MKNNLNRKGRRAEKFGRVGVETGYGPRHALNAQEGSEAVPSGLPEPPVEDLRVRANSMGNLRPALLAQMLGKELGSLTKEDVAKLGISLLMGGEGPEPIGLPPSGGKPVAKTPDSLSHLKGQVWLDAYMKKLDEAGLVEPGAQAKQDALDALKEPPAKGKNSMPPEEEPPFEPNVPRYAKGSKGVRKYRGYSPVRAAGGEAEKTKVGVEKGFGPRHGANAKEGEDLTKVSTDTVPAMLTPREAVLNRNAAELAGRPEIEALNKEGNLLAQKGVDLAARGDVDVSSGDDERLKDYGVGGGDEMRRVLGPWYEEFLKYQQARGRGELEKETPLPLGAPIERILASGGGNETARYLHEREMSRLGQQRGTSDMKNSKQKHSSNEVPAYGKLPSPPQAQPAKGGGFYPPGMSKFAAGDASVPVGIGAPNPQVAYSKDQVDFKAPDLSGFLRDMAAEAKKRGISEAQMAGIAKQFAGMGGGGAPAGGDAPYDMLGGQYASFSGGAPGYQDGISEVGYPPFISPNAEFSYDRGGWVGAYDPRYSFPGYARGNPDVPAWADPGDLGINTGPGGFGRPSTIGEGGRSGYINRSSWGGGQPGMPWSPTMIPTTYNPQGYPFAVPVQGPDQNVQGVGRTHNLRQNQ